MLSSARNLLGSFFTKVIQIDISIDSVYEDKQTTAGSAALFHDEGDSCLQLVDSFNMDDSFDIEPATPARAVFSLKEEVSVRLRFHKQHIMLEHTDKWLDDTFVLVKCAAESVLRKLFAAKLIDLHSIPIAGSKDKKGLIQSYSSHLLMDHTFTVQPQNLSAAITAVTMDLDAGKFNIIFNPNLSSEQLSCIKQAFSASFKNNQSSQLCEIVIG